VTAAAARPARTLLSVYGFVCWGCVCGGGGGGVGTDCRLRAAAGRPRGAAGRAARRVDALEAHPARAVRRPYLSVCDTLVGRALWRHDPGLPWDAQWRRERG
jgi:hypothetical protein